MSSEWTVEEVRAEAGYLGRFADVHAYEAGKMLRAYADLLAGMGEPVVHGDRRSNHHVHRGHESIPCYCDANGDHPIGKEITAPPIDLAAVHEVIVEMRTSQISRPDWAEKLEAAIKGGV